MYLKWYVISMAAYFGNFGKTISVRHVTGEFAGRGADGAGAPALQ